MKIGLLCVMLGVCSEVKIINLKVDQPARSDHQNSRPANIGLRVRGGRKRKGFRVKMAARWSAGLPVDTVEKPIPLHQQSFKNRVDTSYALSQEHMYKHRARAIIKPLANFTGEYMCIVQTYAFIDRRSAKLKVIVRESKFDLSYYLNGDGYITVDCHARDISPLPELRIRINEELFETENLKTGWERAIQRVYRHDTKGSARLTVFFRMSSLDTEDELQQTPLSNVLRARKTKSNNNPLPESHLTATTTTVATTMMVEILQAALANLQKKGFNATESSGASSSLPVLLRTTSSMLATIVTIFLIFTTTLL